MIKTQLIATYAVGKVLGGASLTIVLKELWRIHHTLSDQQRGAVQDISYGVLRFYGQLDTLLGLRTGEEVLTHPRLGFSWEG